MPTTDHSDHLTGPQPVAPVLPIAELFAADLLPPRAPQSRSLARTAQRRLDELAADSQLAHATDQARAFLAAPPILILDEATAQADAHSELEIQRAITGLAQGRTVVMIAHRLSTIRSADQIAVVDDGRITETGTHDELLAVGGQYAALWAAQNRTMAGVHDA